MPKPEGQEMSPEFRVPGWEIGVDLATGEEMACYQVVKGDGVVLTVDIDLRTRVAKIFAEKTVQLGSEGAAGLRDDLLLALAMVKGGGPRP